MNPNFIARCLSITALFALKEKKNCKQKAKVCYITRQNRSQLRTRQLILSRINGARNKKGNRMLFKIPPVHHWCKLKRSFKPSFKDHGFITKKESHFIIIGTHHLNENESARIKIPIIQAIQRLYDLRRIMVQLSTWDRDFTAEEFHHEKCKSTHFLLSDRAIYWESDIVNALVPYTVPFDYLSHSEYRLPFS